MSHGAVVDAMVLELERCQTLEVDKKKMTWRHTSSNGRYLNCVLRYVATKGGDLRLLGGCCCVSGCAHTHTLFVHANADLCPWHFVVGVANKSVAPFY